MSRYGRALHRSIRRHQRRMEARRIARRVGTEIWEMTPTEIEHYSALMRYRRPKELNLSHWAGSPDPSTGGSMNQARVLVAPELLMDILNLPGEFKGLRVGVDDQRRCVELIVESERCPDPNEDGTLKIITPIYQRNYETNRVDVLRIEGCVETPNTSQLSIEGGLVAGVERLTGQGETLACCESAIEAALQEWSNVTTDTRSVDDVIRDVFKGMRTACVNS